MSSFTFPRVRRQNFETLTNNARKSNFQREEITNMFVLPRIHSITPWLKSFSFELALNRLQYFSLKNSSVARNHCDVFIAYVWELFFVCSKNPILEPNVLVDVSHKRKLIFKIKPTGCDIYAPSHFESFSQL